MEGRAAVVCGIFGVIGAAIPDQAVERVLELLRHRGPDDAGWTRVEHGVLAHTRLSIIDLSPLGHQPMANARGTVWITHNGEVYNYLELRRELSHYPFRTRTDTEVILAAYETWGEAFLGRLRGMFAFALWDAEHQKLLCATDRFTIKPLYYHFDGRRCVFASEIKPMALCGVPLRPDERSLYDYLTFGLLDHDENTLFEGIRQLRPGTYLTLQGGVLAVRKYWDLEARERVPRPGTETREIEEKLEEAVRLHLRGDVEVGLSLSSGLDSTLLRTLVLRSLNGGRPLKCFTYGFPDTPYDESRKAASRGDDRRCVHQVVDLKPEPIVEGLTELVYRMEEPVGGLGIYGYWLNARLAAENGIKVLLDGQGADETFGGYRYYYEVKLRQLWQQGERQEAREEFRRLQETHGGGLGSFEALIRAEAPTSLIRAPDSTSLASDYVDPEFTAQFAGRAPEFAAPFDCAVRNAMYTDLFALKIPKLLRFQDRCAMAWSVEVRVPYLDHVLVEALFEIPTEILLQGGLTKSLLRTIAARHLPAAELQVPKLYVSAPQREWVKTVWRASIRELIEDSVLAKRGYIDPTKLLAQFETYCESKPLGNSFFAWKFLNLELWHRVFMS